MKIILALATLAAATAAPASPFAATDQFTDARTGYVVQVRGSGGWMKLSGKNPATGATFKLDVTPSGHVTGLWDGRPVDFVTGAKKPATVIAQN